ncbi:MAG: 5-methylthioribulose-1-phosphate isomerase [Gammaproteobacteria bacterium]
MSDRFIVIYQLTPGAGEDVEAMCRGIALEQTVEMDADLIGSSQILDDIVGDIRAIDPLAEPGGSYRAEVAYHVSVTAFALPQLLNVLFGNISIKNNIRIVGLRLPETLLARWRGPSHGIAGIRRLVEVEHRPLAVTALKPMGSSPEALARMAEAFARGGGDIVKDDHGLADQSFCPFRERVARCQERVTRAAQATGHPTRYFPNISAPHEELEAQMEFAVEQGVQGVLVSPFLLGLDTVRYLSEKYPVAFMAHPALTGTHFHDRRHGMIPAVLLGTLFRLAGCDLSIYPNRGGRFSFTADECLAINDALREPLGQLAPAFPVPAGGMSLARIPEMTKEYGRDTAYLIGGGLLREDPDLGVATRRFVDAIEKSVTDQSAGRG